MAAQHERLILLAGPAILAWFWSGELVAPVKSRQSHCRWL
jgi:hypothetical protein